MNEEIKNAILNKEAKSFGKIGGIEGSHILSYLLGSVSIDSQLYTSAGIYVKTLNELENWCLTFIESIKNLDYILEWNPNKQDKLIIDYIWDGVKKFYSFEGIEPFVFGDKGWHYSLHDKKVLCVSPFSETVKSQANNFSKIWPKASIGEIVTVASPYPEILVDEKQQPVSWCEKLNGMINEIDQIDDFDFATVGCGGFSLIICEHIKTKRKRPCVHLGGGNQILYGIRGARWDDSFKGYDWYGTEYWTRPLKNETPKNGYILENGAYW